MRSGEVWWKEGGDHKLISKRAGDDSRARAKEQDN